jgi:homoserine kinase type II
MAVFTEVSLEQAQQVAKNLGLGTVTQLRGIEGGIENTNYFLSTQKDQDAEQHYVLTLFERLTAEQLPFYLYLMKHLAQAGIPVPDPQANAYGEILLNVCDKPAAVVNKLSGKSQLQPQPAHCAAVGDMLARMHLAGQDYGREQPNLRGLAWWNDTVPLVLPFLDAEQSALIQTELAWQNHLAASPEAQALPKGPVHADLFRDNVMFDGEQLTGFFDFYFAGCDSWLFDVAVCLNDWCIDLSTGQHHEERAQALVQAYQAVRPFTKAEHHLFPSLLRAAALRFWVSRLWDFHLPRQASLLKPHDPRHFERVLQERVKHPWSPA